MKHVTKQLFSIAMLVSAFAYAKDDVHGTRSVGPAYRTAFTGNGLISGHKCCGESDTFNAHFSAGFEFSHSMNKEKLAKYFTLGDTTSISFGKADETTADVVAVNFFLPEDHESTVTFNPKFWAMNGEFRLRVGLGELMEGVWFDVNLPIVHAKYDLGLTPSVKTAGTAAIPEEMSVGTESVGTFAYADPVAALLGDKAVTGNTLVNAPLTYGKFGTAEDGKKTKIGDVHIALGYDLINKDDAQLGLAVLGHINGDEVSNAKYVNTPSIGTAGRHGVGARLDGSVRLWENNETSLSAHLRADGAYIFDATVRRSFDFTANGVWSRYLLLKKRSDYQTVTSIVNAVNVTSLQAKIGKFGVYDVNLMLSLSHCAWEVNAGYNIGGATKEKLSKWVDTIAPSTYTFFGYDNAPVTTATTDTTHAPTINIDGSNGTAGTTLSAANLAAQSITNELLNQDSGLRPNTMSHRVYANLGYCYDKSEWMPTVSVGFSAEFSADNKSVRTYGAHGTMGISF